MSLNRVMLIAHLGKDPQVNQTAGGSLVASFSAATSERWTDAAGVKQERTEWHNIVTFGKLAEFVGQYVKKGAKVYIEGKLQTRKWQDQSGQDRYTTEIIAHSVQSLDKAPSNRPPAHSGEETAGQPVTQGHTPTAQEMRQAWDDDAPF